LLLLLFFCFFVLFCLVVAVHVFAAGSHSLVAASASCKSDENWEHHSEEHQDRDDSGNGGRPSLVGLGVRAGVEPVAVSRAAVSMVGAGQVRVNSSLGSTVAVVAVVVIVLASFSKGLELSHCCHHILHEGGNTAVFIADHAALAVFRVEADATKSNRVWGDAGVENAHVASCRYCVEKVELSCQQAETSK
jgi:hypothetical protein